MPETRYIDQFQNGVRVRQVAYEVSDDELAKEADEKEVRDELLAKGRAALTNWGSLTVAQKDRILKALLRYVLWKEG